MLRSWSHCGHRSTVGNHSQFHPGGHVFTPRLPLRNSISVVTAPVIRVVPIREGGVGVQLNHVNPKRHQCSSSNRSMCALFDRVTFAKCQFQKPLLGEPLKRHYRANPHDRKGVVLWIWFQFLTSDPLWHFSWPKSAFWQVTGFAIYLVPFTCAEQTCETVQDCFSLIYWQHLPYLRGGLWV